MSVCSVGIDMLDLKRMKKSYHQFGMRLVNRILHESEIARFHKLAAFAKDARGHARLVRFLGVAFCVKEAVSKALGTGMHQGVAWRQIALDHHASGAPFVVLHGNAKLRSEYLGIATMHISITDEASLVSSVCVASF